MWITVILCTYNRCSTLAKALESLALESLPDSDEWEVLVVDNNSVDKTREVVEEFCCRYPGRFRYLFESRQGKSNALNAGIREARGDILAFADDDVTAEPMWLRNLTAALRDNDLAGAGGRILPHWTCAPPRWLPSEGRYASAPFALFDLGLKAGPLAEPPFGTNMAFRKAMFEKYGGFRTDLGPCPGSEIRSEDTEFGRRLLAGGEQLWYEPSAVVYHPVPENRLVKKYHLAWWYDKGRADIREVGIPRNGLRCKGVPLCLFRRLARWTLQWMIEVRRAQRFEAKMKLWGIRGAIAECCNELLATKRQVLERKLSP